MRKSAVLWEAGHDNEAEDVLQRAIVAVRSMLEDERSIAGPSREAWATLVALGWDNRQMHLKRLRDLAPFRLRRIRRAAVGFGCNGRKRGGR